MNGYNFTSGARMVLARARFEASQLGHDYVGPPHILLGLLLANDNDTMAVLKKFQIAPSAVERELLRRVERGNHVSEVGGAHLLLGIVGEVKNPAAETLVDLGVTLDGARDELRRLVGGDMVATNPEWLSELGPLTRQLADSLADMKNPRHAEDLLLVVVSDHCGARHLLEASGVDIGVLQREIVDSTGAGGGVSELLTAAKGEQTFLEDCALASHHVLLAYLALRPAHGYRAMSDHGVTHASVRAFAERIFG